MENTLNGFCSHLLPLKTWFYLDTETTGLYDAEICQLAVVRNDGQIEWNTLIKTIQPIPPDATNIHGITDAMVSDAPTYAQISEDLQNLLKGQTVVIYNAVYDRKMLHRSAERNGLEHYAWKENTTFLCAMEAFAEFYGEWNDYHQSYRWQTLKRAALHCHVNADNAHDAAGDCLMTRGITDHMLNWYKNKVAAATSEE